MNIKDAYIHNGLGVLRELQVTAAGMLQLKRAAKDSNDAYVGWEDVYNLTNIKPTNAGTADNVPWTGITGKPETFPVATHDHDDRYLKLAGNTTSTPVTGPIYIDGPGLFIRSKDATKNIWEVVGDGTAWTSNYGFYLQYYGAGSGNNNDLILYSHGQASTDVEVYRVHQDGSFIFKTTPKVGTSDIYHAGNLTINTLMGTTAIGDSDEPVYWSGTAFVKANAYPTKASWNYDDVYLKLSGGDVSGAVSIRKDLTGNLSDWTAKQHMGPLEVGRTTNTMCVAIGVTDDNYGYIQTKGKNITTPGDLVLLPGGGNLYKGNTNNVIWHAGNDGANSGLDADLLDGNHASAFVTLVGVTDDATNHANQLRYVKGGTSTYFTVPYATNADTVDGKHASAFVEKIISTGSVVFAQQSSYQWSGALITTPFTWNNPNTPGMFAFTIRIYIDYEYTDLVISGYCYGDNKWHDPECFIIGGNKTYEVKFGWFDTADSAGAKHLYVWFGKGKDANNNVIKLGYGGFSIMNVHVGHTGINVYQGWSATNTSPDDLTNVQRSTTPGFGKADSATTATTATTATYASNVGSAGTAGTNYVTAAKVIATCNWYDTMTGSDTDTVINRWSEIVDFVANFEETPDLATYLSNNYLAKSGGTMTGQLKWKDSNALPEQTSPQYFLCIDSFTNGGATKWASKANTLKALTGLTSTAIGDSDEPVYWDGSKFVKAGAYPTKASWNYDDVYPKKYSYSLPPQKCVKITYSNSAPVLISAGRSNGQAQFLLAGLGYGADGWTRNQFRCLIPSTFFNWKLSNSACTVELYHNTTNSGNAVVTVISTGDITFTETNALSGDADTKRFACYDELTWSNISGKPDSFTPAAHTHYIGTTATQSSSAAQDLTGISDSTFSGVMNITGKQDNYTQGIRIHDAAASGTHAISSIWFRAGADSGFTAGMQGITADSTGMRFRLAASASGTTPTDYLTIAYGGAVTVANKFTASSSVYFTGLTAGTSDPTDSTEFLTSYASNNGFADTTGAGQVYRRKASTIYNYIKGKTDTLYLAKTATGAADRPIYINSSGAATQTTYRMAGTNATATTALAITSNLATGIWYVNGTSDIYNQSDGVVIANKCSDSWISEIYQDYRTGQIAVRGKNNGTWTAWRKVLDSSNYATLITDLRNNIIDLRTNPQTFNPTYLKDIVFISEADYGTLVSNGSITKNGITHTYNLSNWYVIEDKVPEYAEEAGNATYASYANLVDWSTVNNSTAWEAIAFGDHNTSQVALHHSAVLRFCPSKNTLFVGTNQTGLSTATFQYSDYGVIAIGDKDHYISVDGDMNFISNRTMYFKVNGDGGDNTIYFTDVSTSEQAYLSAYLNWTNVIGKPDCITWEPQTSTDTYSLSNGGWTQTITLPTTKGSYMLQLSTGSGNTESYLTGVFSISGGDTMKDEISLHLHGKGKRLYARTNGTKLELSSNDATAASVSVTIKYRRMI